MKRREGAAKGGRGARACPGTEPSGNTQFHPSAEGAEGGLDRVDLGGVIEIDDALNVLRTGIEPPCQFRLTDLLRKHLVQQQNLRGQARRRVDQFLPCLGAEGIGTGRRSSK